uniref:Ig-like domain-containing protein n=1 Tax=Callorhinchus milii TaxID=7868 RepID=A0A4W3HWK2_CALMI
MYSVTLTALHYSNPVPVSGHEEKLRSVTGTKGGDATLPCSFTIPNTYQNRATVTVLWRRGRPHGQLVFNYTLGLTARTNSGESETVNEGNRYKLVRNVGDGDASLKIRGLELNDTVRYFCHVHTLHCHQNTPAVILSLSLVAGGDIVCSAEGEPPANITWIDPEHNTLPINTSHTPVTHVPDKHQTVGEIRGPRLRGTYHCVAENTQGSDARDILAPGPQSNGGRTVYIMVSIVVLLVLVTAIIIWRVKRGRCLQTKVMFIPSESVSAARTLTSGSADYLPRLPP